MKKWLWTVLGLMVLSANSLGAKMGDYIQIWQNINTFKQSPTPQSKEACKNLEMMLTAIDQTMAETVTLMLATAEKNNKQTFCMPKSVNLNASVMTKLIMEGFNHSNLTFEQKREMPAAFFVIEELHRQFPCGAAETKEALVEKMLQMKS